MANEPYLGGIFMFGGNFAPRGYALCNGQLLSIGQNSALFSILGTTFGGDGIQTFGLPNLQGRAPIHAGTDNRGNVYNLGDMGGAPSTQILTGNLPPHNHLINCDAGGAANTDPTNSFPGNPGVNAGAIYSGGPANATMAAATVSQTGGGIPVPTQSPFLAVNFIIATTGIFPSRN